MIELGKKLKNLSYLTDRIIKDIETLSSSAVEIHTYFQMVKYMTTHQQSQLLDMKPCALNKIKRSCKLTKNSSTLNRSLLARFNIIP